MCVPIELLSMLLSQCEVTTILKNTQFSRYDICKIFNKNKKIGHNVKKSCIKVVSYEIFYYICNI